MPFAQPAPGLNPPYVPLRFPLQNPDPFPVVGKYLNHGRIVHTKRNPVGVGVHNDRNPVKTARKSAHRVAAFPFESSPRFSAWYGYLA